ncbi:hypothetical protein BCR41DRAFT_398631 [Lobosporangium transversale]|uniref:F-box domain-containing protein n=1 Tax=Lobosporangium transversale TaxID=64571 RepID=A0A1Y2GFR0_9FUNG|nr:hypothetical protein BCR41DRAFT_398631 [Lobosporangium transversale]ORZ09648.1 hypothetical protein BCR41DRAFT_398631 [Lobosporangium transversale]|eukprot:XP_021878918.1 hypothetical protein BCR41DRAFT_398631 [Lobosporangium transversale]
MFAFPTETLEHIFSYLGQGTLRFTVSLVCRHWYHVAQAHIRKTVYIAVTQLDYGHGRGGPPRNSLQRMKRRRALKQLGYDLREKLMSAYTLVYNASLLSTASRKFLFLKEEEEVWTVVEDAFTAITWPSSASPSISNSISSYGVSNSPLRIRQLILDTGRCERAWSRLTPLLHFLGHRLTSLRLENIPFRSIVPIHRILDSCPNLQALRIASLKPNIRAQASKLQEHRDHNFATLANLSLHSATTNATSIITIINPTIENERQCQLQSATFENLGLSLTALESFVHRCPNLNELRIISAQPIYTTKNVPSQITNFLFYKTASDQFFHRLSSPPPPVLDLSSSSTRQPPIYLPKLKSLYVSISSNSRSYVMEEIAPIPQFPMVERWGFSTMSMERGLPFSGSILLDRHIRLNALTAVEISKYRTNTLDEQASNRIIEWVHHLLCSSPQLQHFKMPEIRCPIRLFYVTKDLRMKLNDKGHLSEDEAHDYPIQQKVWACRQLKTLHMLFTPIMSRDKALDEMARVVLGYLVRACPELEDLLIHDEYFLREYPEHVCLLSRLKRLKWLHLGGFTCLQFDWIKRYYHYDLRDQIKVQWEYDHYIGCPCPSSSQRIKTSLKRLWRDLRLRNSSFDSNDAISMSELHILRAFAKEKEREKEKEKGEIGKGEVREEDGTKANEKEINDDEREVIGGVDMTHLGKLQDIVNYFQDRRSSRDECLWPDLETITFYLDRFADQNTKSALYEHIKKFRPEIKIIFLSDRMLHQTYLTVE